MIEESPIWISPEKNLLKALINRALMDLADTTEREAVIKWFFTGDIEDDFSFPWVCYQLDLDIISMKNKVEKVVEETKAGRRSWWRQ